MKGRIFKPDQVPAIQSGTMTQFMQEVKPQPVKQGAVEIYCKNGPGSVDAKDLTAADSEMDDLLGRCPFGKVGDIIYCKETTVLACEWDGNGERPPLRYYYRSDDEWKETEWHDEYNDCPVDSPKWKSAVHMPRQAARLFLSITNIRVMRVQELTDKDVQKQGFIGVTSFISQDIERFKANKYHWIIDFNKYDKP